MDRRVLSFTLIVVIMCTAQTIAEPEKPDCSCGISGIWRGKCMIDVAPPKGYRCHCKYNIFWCSGTAIRCDDPDTPQCSGCVSRKCCTGDCTGYDWMEKTG